MNNKADKKLAKEFDSIDRCCLSKKNIENLKGVLIICVFIQQLYRYSGIIEKSSLFCLKEVCRAVGFFSMAVFVFLSGYELLETYNNSKTGKNFGRNSILPLYISNILLVAIYGFLNVLIGNFECLSVDSIIKSLTFGGTIIINGWYIQILLLYSIVFYLLYRCFKIETWFYQMTALGITYSIVCHAIALPSSYYEYTLIFIVGMLWYKYSSVIESWIKKNGVESTVFVTACILCLSAYWLSNTIYPVSFRVLSYFFLIPIVLMGIKKINIQCKLIQFLGRISLEIYVVQGIFWSLFSSNIIRISISWMYVIAVGSISIVCAYLLHLIEQSVYMVCYGKVNIIVVVKRRILAVLRQITKQRSAWENFKEKAKKDLNISSCPDISFEAWKKCWDNGLEKKPQKEEYKKFAEDMKQLLDWRRSKIKKNRKMNFLWKGIYIVLFVALSILYLFFFLSGDSKGEGALSGIGDNWAVFLTFPVLSLAVAKWLDVKKYQETWTRHYMQKALLEDEMYKYIYAIEPYDTEEAEEIFVRQFLKIKQANDLKFIENLETKEKSITDMFDQIQKLRKN